MTISMWQRLTHQMIRVALKSTNDAMISSLSPPSAKSLAPNVLYPAISQGDASTENPRRVVKVTACFQSTIPTIATVAGPAYI
jgi:hypothetical protein